MELNKIILDTKTVFNSLIDYQAQNQGLNNTQKKQLNQALNKSNDLLMLLLNLSSTINTKMDVPRAKAPRATNRAEPVARQPKSE